MIAMKNAFKLNSRSKSVTGNIYIWDVDDSPNWHPYFNVVIDGTNIQSIALSLTEPQMKELALGILKNLGCKKKKKKV